MPRARLRLVASEGEPLAPPSTPPVDDGRLLAAIRAGDQGAASELHDRLRPRVDRTIRALLGGGHPEHDDLAQQTFVEIVLSLERWRGECSLETWGATIAARTVWKFLRKRGLERRVFRDAGLGLAEPKAPSSARMLVARDVASRVRAHLDAMAPDKAQAFLLHDVCGFDAREVAGIAGISEAAAHARIARGRRELHERLAEDPDLRGVLLDLEDGG